MNTPTSRTFPHRLDWNGVYHSICLDCFATVATSYSEQTLLEEERQHRCPETLRKRPAAAEPLARAS